MTRLEFMRRHKSMTQESLGDALGFSRYRISFLEKKRPRPENISKPLRKALENFFQLSVEELIGTVPGLIAERPRPEQSPESEGKR